MNRLSDRFARHDETGRATELDPSTFDYPEQFQMTPADYRLRAWVWRGLAVWCLVMAGLGAWALWTLIDAVF